MQISGRYRILINRDRSKITISLAAFMKNQKSLVMTQVINVIGVNDFWTCLLVAKGEVMDKENSYAASTQMSRLAFSAVDGNS